MYHSLLLTNDSIKRLDLHLTTGRGWAHDNIKETQQQRMWISDAHKIDLLFQGRFVRKENEWGKDTGREECDEVE